MSLSSRAVDNIMQDVRTRFPRIGGTACSSLRSALRRLPADATAADAFALVARKARAAGYYPNERDVVKAWERAGIF